MTPQKIQKVYFIASMMLLACSFILFGLGAIFAKTVTAAPVVILSFATYILYYHFLHFLFGFGSLIYFLSKMRKKLLHMRVVKTIFGIFMTPISLVVLYAAILLLALTSCAS